LTGCHIDGYIAVVASTIVVGEVASDRKADVIAAAQTAAECVLKMLKPGQVNEEITRVIQKVADIYGCQPIEGVLSHEMKRFVIDGNKVRCQPAHVAALIFAESASGHRANVNVKPLARPT
jgi:methionine aminopeptidase